MVACGTETKVFKKQTVELFPPVSGKLTENGKPLAGVKLKRSYEFIDITDGEIHDYTTTDSGGRFSFPELTMQSRHADNPFRTNVIWQGIRIDTPEQTEDDEIYLWDANSRGVKHNAYFTEMLSALNCDLSTEEGSIYVINSNYPSGVVIYPIVSICRWPIRAEIEKKKAADVEEFGELQNLNKYGDINGLI
ncbi:carboxypeptidase regulatory-like domain-containing protein [Agarivorans sp. B2Z047]|nr:carboxypeptidase regulatory-like domain-containing protein [Agarivorans sp. B2Z047]